MSSIPRLSVIIPTHERLEKLRRVLTDLDRQTLPSAAFEVLVVDDGSLEDPRPALAALHPAYALTVLRVTPGGPGRARNAALELARGEYVLFLNDDIRLAAELLETHLACHAALGEPAAVLGAFRFTEALREDLFCRVLEDFGLTHTLQLQSERWYDYRVFWTSNLSVPRAAVEYVGGFDVGFPEPSQDDVDLGLRLERQLSMRVYFTARADCRHDHPHTPAMWRKRNRMLGRNVYRMHLKHGTSDFSAIKEGAEFSRSKLEALRAALEAREPEMARWRAEMELQVEGGDPMPQVEGEPMRQVEGDPRLQVEGGDPIALREREIRLEDGQILCLPRDQELLVAWCLGRLSPYEQSLGVVEAALADLDAADDSAVLADRQAPAQKG